MLHTDRTNFKQCTQYGVRIYNHAVPIGAIYGTYYGKDNTSVIKYIFSDFASLNAKSETVNIMVYDYAKKRWCGMVMPNTNELIRFIRAGIAKLGLENTRVKSERTVRRENRIVRENDRAILDSFHGNKRVRKRQSTALPWNGSPNYYGLTDSSNMRRNEAGEREFREKMTNNKVYG